MAAKKDKKILDLVVTHISLVKNPATGKAFTLKSGDQEATLFAVAKADDERQVAYGIVYPAGQVDSHGHYADAVTIRRAREHFMRDRMVSGNVDREHTFHGEDAYVTECWEVRKGDPLFPDEPEGSWAAGIKVLDPDLWRACKAGEVTGFSLAGWAALEKSDAPADRSILDTIKDGFAAIQATITRKEGDMPLSEEDHKVIETIVAKAVAEGLAKGAPAVPDKNAPESRSPGDGGVESDLGATVAALKAAVEGMPAAIEDAVAKAVAKGATEGGIGDGGGSRRASFI